MSTPDFLSQNDANYTPVRFYTALDPYFYTVDNRPLQDLEDNLKASRSGGGDASRRASALLGLNLGALYSELVTTQGRSTAITGLQVVKTGNNSVRVSPGAYYDTRGISTSVTDSMVKQALLTKNVDFNIPSPVTNGTSMVYTIEATFIELTQATAASSQLPYIDSANVFLPSTYIHGELQLSIISGVAATTGSEVPPATSAGKIPLYNITLAQGSSNYKVQLHANAPRGKFYARNVTPVPLAVNGAVIATINEMQVLNFAKSATTGVVLPSVLNESAISPYLPIRLKITFSPSMVSGNIAFKVRYKGFSSGELTTVAGTSTSLDTPSISVVAGGVQTYTTTVSIPNSEFAGFVNNKWVVNKEFLNIILERVSADALDTNPGDVRVMSIVLVQ